MRSCARNVWNSRKQHVKDWLECQELIGIYSKVAWTRPPPERGITQPILCLLWYVCIKSSKNEICQDLEATVKKCVFVKDWFKCLRESIFFGKSDSKRIGFPANHILSEISTVKNCIQICLPQDRFSGSCRDRNLNVAWGKHIPQEYDFPRTSVYYLRENRFNC